MAVSGAESRSPALSSARQGDSSDRRYFVEYGALSVRLRRPLTEPEAAALDIGGIAATYRSGKEELADAILAEQKKAARSIVKTGSGSMRVTKKMTDALADLHFWGDVYARQEAARLGIRADRTTKFFAELPPRVKPLETRLRSRLGVLERRTTDRMAEVGLGEASQAAVLRAAARVPGAVDMAGRMVSSGFLSGTTGIYEEHRDLFQGWQYSAVLDEATCDVCEGFDGEEYQTLDELFSVLPDFGPNPDCLGGDRCRCRGVPTGPNGGDPGNLGTGPAFMPPEVKSELDSGGDLAVFGARLPEPRIPFNEQTVITFRDHYPALSIDELKVASKKNMHRISELRSRMRTGKISDPAKIEEANARIEQFTAEQEKLDRSLDYKLHPPPNPYAALDREQLKATIYKQRHKVASMKSRIKTGKVSEPGKVADLTERIEQENYELSRMLEAAGESVKPVVPVGKTLPPQLRPFDASKLNTVYRTDHVHPDWLKSVQTAFGEGKYYSLSREEAEAYLTSPHAVEIKAIDPKLVEAHAVPGDLKLLEIDVDTLNSAELQAFSQDALRQKVLDAGYDGVVVRTESMNLGGNQLVIYRGPLSGRASITEGESPSLSMLGRDDVKALSDEALSTILKQADIDIRELQAKQKALGYSGEARSEYVRLSLLEQRVDALRIEASIERDRRVLEVQKMVPQLVARARREVEAAATPMAKLRAWSKLRGLLGKADESAATDEALVREVGKAFEDEINARAYRTERYARPGSIAERGQAMNANQERAKIVAKILSELRDVGPTDERAFLKTLKGNSEAKALVGDAAKLMPREWVDTSAEKGAIKLGARKRGFYRHSVVGESELKISFRYLPGGRRGFQVAVHEFGHRIQYTTMEIQRIEQAFYRRRTEGWELQKLNRLKPGYGYGNSEVVRLDDFAYEPYIGRDYGDRIFEVLTMGLQELLGGDYEVGIWRNDPDLARFILGLLALL